MDEFTFAREVVVPGIVPEVTDNIRKSRTARVLTTLGVGTVVLVGTLTYIFY